MSDDDDPVPPIFVWDHGDLAIYGSVASAASQLEPTDVRDGVYVAFDAQGAPLTLDVERAARRYWLFTLPVDRVTIRRAPSPRPTAPTLHAILVDFLATRDATDLQSLPLATLQSLACQRTPIRR